MHWLHPWCYDTAKPLTAPFCNWSEKIPTIFLRPCENGALLDIVCIEMVLKLLKAEWNSNVLRSVTPVAISPVHTKTLVQMLNTDVPSIWFWKIIQDCLILHQEAVRKRKSSSPLTKTEASFEYLNHTHDPTFAVHPCPSPIFCHQEDKSELRGATPHFLPRLTPKPAQEWLPANFTVHSDFSTTISAIRLLSPATSVIGGFLHRQSRVHCWLYLCHTGCHTDTP